MGSVHSRWNSFLPRPPFNLRTKEEEALLHQQHLRLADLDES